MRGIFQKFLHPYYFAGVISWAAVAFLGVNGASEWFWLGLWLLAFIGTAWGERDARILYACFVIETICILALLLTGKHPSTTPVLQVVFAAQLAMAIPLRPAFLIALALTIVQFLALSMRLTGDALPMTLAYAGFQTFALMTAHYARTAELATQQLSFVNADLLATRALLESSTRHHERLRVSRDLHDVVGHKLTALRLNLRALAASNPDETLRMSEKLSAEILQDIRDVVSELRDSEGYDIGTALLAMARAFPHLTLHLQIEPETVIADGRRSDAILRICQEAMTNAVKHGNAANVFVNVSNTTLRIEDNGSVLLPLKAGNGVMGIRERVDELGGEVRFAQSERGGLLINVEFA